MTMAKRVMSVVLSAQILCAVVRADESVVNSLHDLSARGPGRIRAVDESEICIFCHTPHNAAPQTPLWNRQNPRVYYRIYESSTTQARIDQPSGPSKMCLSCHDGTLALGNVLSRPVSHPIVMTNRTIPPGPADLTTDLSDDHPIGFHYDRALSNRDPQIRAPEVVSRELPMGVHNTVHCTTCHDPHNNELGDFLRISDERSAICITCHDLNGWLHSAHATSNKRTGPRVVDPRELLKYQTVSDNGCLNCHKIHSAPHPERLLRSDLEEEICLNCHSGAVASFNIAADIGKRSAHAVRPYRGIHDPEEEYFTMRRHVECVDCHNPHAVLHDSLGVVQGTLGALVSPSTRLVSGVAGTERRVNESRLGYEICLKCHGEGAARGRFRFDRPERQVPETNVRREFQTSNPSFHPVFGPRGNPDVVSLIPPLRTSSVITCTDCHNSDNARAFGGSGANGPHGSLFEPILVRNYQTADFTSESAFAYALCYRCHSRDSILSDESFSLHRQHIVNVRAPCSVCHDAHGVARGPGGSINHTSLINFDVSVARPASTALGPRLEYVDTGQFSGSCTLVCHSVTHVNFTYSGGGGAARAARSRGSILGMNR